MSVRHAVAELVDVDFAFVDEPVLSNVSLRVDPGEFVALVGPNGSGKSTLVRLLLGLLRPGAGTIRLLGHDPLERFEPWRVGYAAQIADIPDLPVTVREAVSTGCVRRGDWLGWKRTRRTAGITDAIAAAGLGGREDRQVAELSGGLQQRVKIARSLAGERDLLVLDEPFVSVDVQRQRELGELLARSVRDRGVAVLLVSHELGAVAHALDRVVVLKERVRFDGKPEDLRAQGVSLGTHPDDLPVWLEELT